MSRPKKHIDQLKCETIILRITKDMKQQLILLAEQSRREFSDYLRLCLEDIINNKINKL